jgi:polyisoprenoid-binding protein YceI
MNNYLFALAATAALGTATCSAADTAKPATAATKPAAAQPTAAAAAKPAAAPAATTNAAPAAGGVPRYVQAPAGSSLTFSFVQAGAENQGAFRQFATELAYDEKNLAASSLKVTVQTASFDTQDKDRNDTLAGTDLLDPAKFPTAQFVSSSLAKGAKGVEAVGKLTLHGVTKDVRLPLAIHPTTAGVEISGETTLKRLDYGIGQGDWKSTEWVDDEIKVQYKVALTRAAR